MLCANTPVNVKKLKINERRNVLMTETVRNPTEDSGNVGTENRVKKQEYIISQIGQYSVKVRFSDKGFRLENLIDAYIKEKLSVFY